MEGTRKHIFVNGLRDGIPIAMGYYAVAFSIGIIAKTAGLNVVQGFISSFFTRASAGEYGAYTLIIAQATLVEVIMMGIVTNLRYLLMSTALSQKLTPDTSLLNRIGVACCVTDEVFGISVNYKGMLDPLYTYGAALISTIFWAAGTASGIYAGNVLPVHIVSALSVALYGMFIAIIIPPSRQDRNVLYAVCCSFVLSAACAYAPLLSAISTGMRTILLTIIISSFFAWLKPIHDAE